MNPRLERRYRCLLLAYPPQVRAARAEEILTTLAEAGGDRRLPPAREAGSLLVEGMRARSRLAAADGLGRIWADGVQLGVLLLVFANLGVLAWQAWRYPAWTVLLGVTAVAVLRARPRGALVLTAVAALAAARPLLPVRPPQDLFGWAPAYGDWSTVARHVAPVLLLALLSLPVLRRQLRARAWWWLLVPVAQVAVPVLVVAALWAAGSMGLASTDPAQLERLGELGWTAARSAPEAVLAAAALGLALVARDHDPPSQRSCCWSPGWPGRWSSVQG